MFARSFRTMLAGVEDAPADADNDLFPRQASLDRLADAIINAQNRVVHCQAELEKANMAVEDANAAFLQAVKDRGLGFE